MRRLAIAVVATWALIGVLSPARAQNADSNGAPGTFAQGIVEQFDPAAGLVAVDPVAISAEFTAPTADRPALLLITARITPGQHTYSLTQPPGGPRPTRIELEPSANYRLLAPFRAYPEPKSHVEQGPVWTGVTIEEHEGDVRWYAPIELTAGVEPARLEIRGNIALDVCKTGGYCQPVKQQITARFAASSDADLPFADVVQSAVQNPQAAIGSFQATGSQVKLTGRIEPAAVRPGQSAQLMIAAEVPPGWHVYAYSPRDDKPGSKPTLIALGRTSGIVPQRPTTDAEVKVDDSVPTFGTMRYHEGPVTWTTQLDVPPNAPPGEYRITGLVGYQACESAAGGGGSCEFPQAARFEGTLRVGDGSGSEGAPLTFAAAANYKQAASAAAVFADYLDGQHPVGPPSSGGLATAGSAQLAEPTIRSADVYDLERVSVAEGSNSLGYYIALAFVGGIILNLMPCVLPVIGLKVMSFVEQAGRSRTHALVLNVWFAAGIVSVFLLLAILACLPQLGLGDRGLGWGGQFGSTAFNVTIAAVVFAMALSLLGVWEVPIPGFFGSSSIQAAAAKEGPLGAFLKGVVTTVLATPCTAPFMATAVAWAVTQSVATTLIVFTSLGLGMASPYILVGVYPELLRFLPKPGMWMETFKQITGFVLMATVIFVLSFIDRAAIVPTVTFLLGVGVACWLIARTPLTAEFRDRVQTWALAGAVILLFGTISFGWLFSDGRGPADVAWQPFSLERLKKVAVDEGRTVIVDFSAEWCFNCKVLEKAVLHTDEVEAAIARAGAVTMYADYTDYPPEIARTIKALRANGVPVIAVFPGDAPYEPIVFRGGYTKGGLIEALEQASGRRLQSTGGAVAEAASASPPLN